MTAPASSGAAGAAAFQAVGASSVAVGSASLAAVVVMYRAIAGVD